MNYADHSGKMGPQQACPHNNAVFQQYVSIEASQQPNGSIVHVLLCDAVGGGRGVSKQAFRINFFSNGMKRFH